MADKQTQILDRPTREEAKTLAEAKTKLDQAEAAHAAAHKAAEKAKTEAERHKDDVAPQKDYRGILKEARRAANEAAKAVKAAKAESDTVIKEITERRAERAKVYQANGQVGQVIPHRKPGWYMVSVRVGGDSLTRHCRLINDDYVTKEGMRFAALLTA